MISVIGWPILIAIFIGGFYFLAKFEGEWEGIKEGKRIDIFWPKITSKNIAMVVAYRCAFITFIFGGISLTSRLLIAILDNTKIDIWSFADGVIMGASGYGIYKMSRVTALFGLIICILSRINIFIGGDYITSSITLIIYGFVYVNAIRATMVYHKNIMLLSNIKNNSV